MEKSKGRGVLIDTNFFIAFLDTTHKFHINAQHYFRYFAENGIVMKISTIAIAEFCVRGSFDVIPWNNLQIVPFNVSHCQKAGDFTRILLDNKKMTSKDQNTTPREIVINDTKMFAQADNEPDIDSFVTFDAKAQDRFNLLSKQGTNFNFIDIGKSVEEHFGIHKTFEFED